MATTSPDNIWTQDSADNYDLVIDAAATATSIQAALTARANSYKGTTAQRTAFTATAPEGTTWADTNGDKTLWIKQGASWQKVWTVGAASSPAPTGITLNAGWKIYAGADSFMRSGTLVAANWAFTYTGADISVSASGDIGNQTIGTLPVPLRPAQETPLASGRSGRVGAFGLLPSGDLMLASVGGTANITSGAIFSCGGTYLSA